MFKVLFLVGGFGSNAFLVKYITKQFESEFVVRRPDQRYLLGNSRLKFCLAIVPSCEVPYYTHWGQRPVLM